MGAVQAFVEYYQYHHSIITCIMSKTQIVLINNQMLILFQMLILVVMAILIGIRDLSERNLWDRLIRSVFKVGFLWKLDNKIIIIIRIIRIIRIKIIEFMKHIETHRQNTFAQESKLSQNRNNLSNTQNPNSRIKSNNYNNFSHKNKQQ